MKLGRVLFVGDAGLYSKANLAELARGAGRYVLATPLAKVKEIRDEVLARPGRYATITPELEAKEVIVGEGERRRRYILCLNREEAARQQHRRRRLLEQLQAELEALGSDHPKAACRLLASRRFGPYLGQDAQGRPFVDRDKVNAAERLDGKFVLTSNDDTLSVTDIALGYKGLWIIEQLLPQDEDDRARAAADVPLGAAADHRPRQALRPGPADPAHGRDPQPARPGPGCRIVCARSRSSTTPAKVIASRRPRASIPTSASCSPASAYRPRNPFSPSPDSQACLARYARVGTRARNHSCNPSDGQRNLKPLPTDRKLRPGRDGSAPRRSAAWS